jgi:hypothetical protein
MFYFLLQSYTVEVLYSPLFIVPLTEVLFVTPTFRNLFPITEAHIPQIKELQLLQHKVCGRDSEGMDVSINIANMCNNSCFFKKEMSLVFSKKGLR